MTIMVENPPETQEEKKSILRGTSLRNKKPSEIQKDTGLNKQQQEFVEEYLNTYNATRSYMKAYGLEQENIAAICASRLLSNAKVAKIVSEIEKKRAKLVTEEYIIDRIKHISENSSKDSNKLRGLELLGKAKGIFKESNAPQVAIFQQFNGMEDQMIRDLESQSDNG